MAFLPQYRPDLLDTESDCYLFCSVVRLYTASCHVHATGSGFGSSDSTPVLPSFGCGDTLLNVYAPTQGMTRTKENYVHICKSFI